MPSEDDRNIERPVPTNGLSYLAAVTDPPLAEMTVPELLALRASEHPDRLLLVATSSVDGHLRHLTYGDVYGEARTIAAELLRRYPRGTRIAIYAGNVAEWILIEMAVYMADMVLVALNPSWTASELGYALDHSESQMLFASSSFRSRNLVDLAVEVAAGLSLAVAIEDIASVAQWASTEAQALVEPSARPQDIAMVQYTSGTTGRPKGVMLTHRTCANVSRYNLLVPRIQDGETLFSAMPMFHAVGCNTCIVGPMWIHGSLVLQEYFEPVSALEFMRSEDVTYIIAVPAMIHSMLHAVRTGAAAPIELPTVMTGAANVPAIVIEEAAEVFKATVINVYGQTELGAPFTLTRRDDPLKDIVEAVGTPMPNAECKIVDVVTGETVALGTPGEICARGYQVMDGYLKDPDATEAAVDAQGWLHTGDLGWMSETGAIRLTGRLKELIVRGGENIAPAEVESCIFKHPEVENVAVFAVPDDRLGEKVAAAVHLRRDSPDIRGAIKERCAQDLSRFKVPEYWFFTGSLPTTASGKVQRFVLQDQVASGELRESN